MIKHEIRLLGDTEVSYGAGDLQCAAGNSFCVLILGGGE